MAGFRPSELTEIAYSTGFRHKDRWRTAPPGRDNRNHSQDLSGSNRKYPGFPYRWHVTCEHQCNL